MSVLFIGENNILTLKTKNSDMRKILFIGTLLCLLCSCGSGGGKKFNEDVVIQDRAEYKEYVRLAREREMSGDWYALRKYYEAALEIENVYRDTKYKDWFNSDVAGKLDVLLNTPRTGSHQGHDWVDLGLPSGLKWATCNVGAATPSDYGDYYAWGEISTKYTYFNENCESWAKNWDNIEGDPRHDVATAKWGGSWRMPTKEEFKELLSNCAWTWTQQNLHEGYKVTGRTGQSIFIPAAGFYSGYGVSFKGLGYYWTSTPNVSSNGRANNLYFGDEGRGVSESTRRGDGLTVRPVLKD